MAAKAIIEQKLERIYREGLFGRTRRQRRVFGDDVQPELNSSKANRNNEGKEESGIATKDENGSVGTLLDVDSNDVIARDDVEESATLKHGQLTNEEKNKKRMAWIAQDATNMNLDKIKVRASDFSILKVVGRGGFGLVQIVMEKYDCD